ncbi:MAG: hypothetical protein ACTSP4_00100 [Candidatus Hodarchaeales archaeon]
MDGPRKEEKKKHQVTVTFSGELKENFFELKKEFYITSEAELIRMAVKEKYESWKAEQEKMNVVRSISDKLDDEEFYKLMEQADKLIAKRKKQLEKKT